MCRENQSCTGDGKFDIIAEIIKQTETFVNKEGQRRRKNMEIIGNIIWFLLVGFFGGMAWVIAGCLWCITIIGIPIGLQCFKLAGLAFFPFGKEVRYGGGSLSFIANIFWLLFPGLELAVGYTIVGCFFCITMIGIPFGIQCFKLAKLSLMPFGAEVL